MPKSVRTPILEIAYEEHGPPDGTPVILLHGFPDDPHAYDGVWPLLEDRCRVLLPWLRGYGETRFLSESTLRSGQQAALGADLRDFIDGLGIENAVVGGYDWGGRAACIVAALWPHRVSGLVTCGGYNVLNVAAAANPASAASEYRGWYQWYFHTERGRAGLQQNRRDISQLLWQLWSPNYAFDDATFELTAASFDNPDFVDVVIQSYRHRHGNAPGDPALEEIEAQLEARPPISVPTIALLGEVDGVRPAGPDQQAAHFTGPYERRIIPRAGHFVPRDAPEAFAQAVKNLIE
jgi:pimeloyl-ACP methyl ester carboxylesterase